MGAARETPTMRTRIALALLGCLALARCGGSGSTSGTWVFDSEATLGEGTRQIDEQLKAIPAEQRPMAERMLKGSLEALKNIKFEVEMKSDGTANFLAAGFGDDVKATGTWVEKDGKITLKATTVNGKPAEGSNFKELVLTREGDKLVGDTGTGGKSKLYLKKK